MEQRSDDLHFGSDEAMGSTGASFCDNVNDSTRMGAANCQQGLLNGQVPGSADQAQLLHGLNQVAYGSGS